MLEQRWKLCTRVVCTSALFLRARPFAGTPHLAVGVLRLRLLTRLHNGLAAQRLVLGIDLAHLRHNLHRRP